MRSDHPSNTSVLVWDVPTRLFHWLLVLLVALAWVTGEAEGSMFAVHKLAGYGVAVLLVFRLIGGFAGSGHSRFSDFVGRGAMFSLTSRACSACGRRGRSATIR